MIEIQWVKLKKICEELVGKKVHIQASTDISTEYRSGVIAKEDEVDIIINFNLIKRLESVINALAHELAHVVLKTEDDALIGGEWLKLKKEIKRLYRR